MTDQVAGLLAEQVRYYRERGRRVRGLVVSSWAL